MNNVSVMDLFNACYKACDLMGLSILESNNVYHFAKAEPDKAYRTYLAIIRSFR